MLEKITTDLIGEYNFLRHLAKYQGNLLSALGDRISVPKEFWKGFPVHKIYFTCEKGGILSELGAWQDFSPKEIDRGYTGRFKMVVDQAKVDAAKEMGLDINFPHEQIIGVEFYTEDVPAKIQERITKAASLYNGEHGFDYDYNHSYDGFTAGNVLGEGML